MHARNCVWQLSVVGRGEPILKNRIRILRLSNGLGIRWFGTDSNRLRVAVSFSMFMLH